MRAAASVMGGETERAGDGGLFERAFARHYPRVQRILAGLLGPDDADDATQDVFLRLYHSAMLDQTDDRVGAWLYRVAVNTAYNMLRSRRRQLARLQRAGQLAQADAPFQQSSLNPALTVAQREEAALLRAALEHLSDTHRTVLVLRHAGLSYAEVAAAAGIRPGSVGALLARAEAHLRDHYLRLSGSRPGGDRPKGEQR